MRAISGSNWNLSKDYRLANWIDTTPVWLFAILALTLGLAPFFPEPHLWEKIKMLMSGTLVRPMDMFDFVFHGTPWVLLVIKLVRMALVR